ncbi:hypothetical protein CVT24_007294 [Panaeolus cyanescens]|uniref:Uncharacterized protein n=1 Tax=Panaeolus cyanescens TaxID=181874 RepID=A0A409X8Y8_9AGAR|nr:hypothetical protein CVT24_007294 [Panaeolus cyanescens]
MQRPRAPGESVIRAPPVLDLETLPQNETQTHNLFIIQSIISQAWPAFLAALSFIVATNLSDEIFVEVLASYQAMTNVSGMLGLATPRDTFFNSLSKFAVPPRVVSSLEAWVENPPQTPRSATAALSEGLGKSSRISQKECRPSINGGIDGGDEGPPSLLTVGNRRRVSGIFIPKTFAKSGDFGISKLGGVAMLNIHRLIYRSPDIAWNTTTSHLLMVIHPPYAPQSIRIQAAKVLDDILLIVPRNLSSTGELQAQVQRRVLDVLSQQIIPDSLVPQLQQTTTSVELRRMGLETLHQILQASGHTLVVG